MFLMESDRSTAWFRPFYDRPWSRATRPAAHALWHWHLALEQSGLSDGGALEDERARAEAGVPLLSLPEEVSRQAYMACAEHGLPRSLLAAQVEAASFFSYPHRFETSAELKSFLQSWVVPHGRLLARLAGVDGGWQLPYVDELARAFFLTAHLASLPADMARGRLFIPLDDLAQVGVPEDQLRDGPADEPVRRLLWRQIVRAKDAYAQGRSLVGDLSGRTAFAFKVWWLTGLEVLNEIGRRKYDVWSHPITLSRTQHFRVRLQALAGRTTFGKRRRIV